MCDEQRLNGVFEEIVAASRAPHWVIFRARMQALNGLGVTINGSAANPGTFNAWLEETNNYVCASGDCNNLVLNAPALLTPLLSLVGEVPPPPLADMQAGLASGDFIYVSHVHNQSHFVLLTGWDDSLGAFVVNDPFFNTVVRCARFVGFLRRCLFVRQ